MALDMGIPRSRLEIEGQWGVDSVSVVRVRDRDRIRIWIRNMDKVRGDGLGQESLRNGRGQGVWAR